MTVERDRWTHYARARLPPATAARRLRTWGVRKWRARATAGVQLPIGFSDNLTSYDADAIKLISEVRAVSLHAEKLTDKSPVKLEAVYDSTQIISRNYFIGAPRLLTADEIFMIGIIFYLKRYLTSHHLPNPSRYSFFNALLSYFHTIFLDISSVTESTQIRKTISICHKTFFFVFVFYRMSLKIYQGIPT